MTSTSMSVYSFMNEVRIEAETLLHKGQSGCGRFEKLADAMLTPARELFLQRQVSGDVNVVNAPQIEEKGSCKSLKRMINSFSNVGAQAVNQCMTKGVNQTLDQRVETAADLLRKENWGQAKFIIAPQNRNTLYKKAEKILETSENKDPTALQVIKGVGLAAGLVFVGIAAALLFVPGVICKQIAVLTSQKSTKHQETVAKALSIYYQADLGQKSSKI